MEGIGSFDSMWESFEGFDERAREDGRESRSAGNDQNLEAESSDEQEIHLGASSSSRRGKKSRHTPHQIQELESFFKANPHPDENERLAIGRKLNMEINQVKFWFQNRRTQLKTQTEHHENTILKRENEKLRLENLAMKEAMQNQICNNCGGQAFPVDRYINEQNLRSENARLREELSRLANAAHQVLGRPSSSLAINSMSTGLPTGTVDNNQVPNALTVVPPSIPRMCMAGGGIDRFIDQRGYLERALSAMNELMKLGEFNSPLWDTYTEIGVQTLNFDEYARTFPPRMRPSGFISEASRATGMARISGLDLVEALLDADRWREMFVGMIGSSSTTEVISVGTEGSRDGALQIMEAEIQLVTPLVPPLKVKFIRFSKQQGEGVWAVVDLSVDASMEGHMARRLPSGCIVHDMLNGYSQVTWIEHTEYNKDPVHRQYRRLLRLGLGFGAQKWMCALLRHCRCSTALTLPTADTYLLPGTRRSLTRLAQRMTGIFCAGVCTAGGHNWEFVTNAPGSPRIMIRRSLDRPGDPPESILSATMSVWMPAKHRELFDLLLIKELRRVWDVLCHAHAREDYIHFPINDEANDDHNTISIMNGDTSSSDQNPIMVLQEAASDLTGSFIVYATVDVQTVSMVMTGGDTSSAALLPSGLYLVPGWVGESGAPSGAQGSMLTVAFQMLLQDLAPSGLSMDSINTVNDLVSRTVRGIKEIARSSQHGR